MRLLDFLKLKKTKDRKKREIGEKAPYLFVSYALANADEVSRIIKEFEKRGYHVWYDEGIDLDEKKADKIADALQHAALFLVFLTTESQALANVRREINDALNAGKPVLAVYLKPTNLTEDLRLRLAAGQMIRKYELSEEVFYHQCDDAFERLGLPKTPSGDHSEAVFSEPAQFSSDRKENLNSAMDGDQVFVPKYDKADRDHMRRLLRKATPIIDLIAEDQVPFGSFASAELVDSVVATIGYANANQKDEDALQALRDDRHVLINLYGAIKKAPAFPPLYVQLGNLLRKYGLFDEEVVLLENAMEDNNFSDDHLTKLQKRLSVAGRYRDLDDATMRDSERIAENLRRALRKTPLNVPRIKAMLEQCGDDAVLYDITCDPGKDPDMKSIREKAARQIQNRDFQYALSSHIYHPARTAMILNLYDSLKGDALMIARTVLTDPNDENKAHMLLYCEDEELLMLGWKYVYGARQLCAERLRAIGSDYPEKYEQSDPGEQAEWEENWWICAGETALDILSEDRAVAERLAGAASVDSEPLRFFLSMRHTRKAVRWWHAKKLKNPVYIAYVGSWTSDDQIKEALSVKITDPALITEMIFGDLSGVDFVFGFRKPDDLTLQDRFCVEIMKRNPDRAVREQTRAELLRAKCDIPGVDLTKPDPLYQS